MQPKTTVVLENQVEIIERPDVAMVPLLQHPQGPRHTSEVEIPPALVELLRERDGDERENQAKALVVYLRHVNDRVNHLFQCLVYSIGEIARQHLYREIGIVENVEIHDIKQMCEYLSIDPKLASEARDTYEALTPLFRELDIPTIEGFGNITPEIARSLRQLAYQEKLAKKGRHSKVIDPEERQELRENVFSVLAGDRVQIDLIRSRHEDIPRSVIDFDYEVVEPGDSEPFIRLRPRNMYMKDVLAAVNHRCGFLPAGEDGLSGEWIDVQRQVEAAFDRWAQKKRLSS